MKDKHSFIIAVIIIATISIVLISSILSLSIYNRPLSDEGNNTVSQIITALIAIVSMIIGNKTK